MQLNSSSKKTKKMQTVVLLPGTRIVDVQKTAYLKYARAYNEQNGHKAVEKPVVKKPVKIFIPGTRIIDRERTAYLALAQEYNAERRG